MTTSSESVAEKLGANDAGLPGDPGPETRVIEAARKPEKSKLSVSMQVLIRTVAPVLLALIVAGFIIWSMGVDPLKFYGDILALGLGGTGWQKTLTMMAPLLIISLGLIISFRAQLWNLGYNGTYLLAAAVVAGTAPDIMATLPFGVGIVVLFVLAFVIGAALGYLPALLKAKYGTNEIITSLMLSFIAISVANILVKGPFQDHGVTVPQTRVLDLGLMLPFIPGTRIHVGFIIALVLVVVFHYILTKSSFGLKIDILGASPKAATHAGIDAKKMIIIVFLLSSGMIALAGAVDMLGLWGYMRTNWNPMYGDKILPFVFLARLNPIGSIPLVAFYAILATGGTIAAQQVGLSVDFLLIIVALILFFMTVIEFMGNRKDLGKSYLPTGLFKSAKK
ncbi:MULTISPECIES: ABC transporter permease [unclassified Leucobacter]|uniref:putative B6 ABC transporter permease subunit 2 n=1 Tax=unclassified Leucobacter TaxID=2621730 RepID=UPI00165D515E|nr:MULTISPECIES: ABC transporter permease [unclassified Leucobacter]MBC9926193.1 ABC transporter permease [Leucobacter sp. cx-169]